MAEWIALRIGGRDFAARPLGGASRRAEILGSLPGTVRLVQDEWSGALLKSVETSPGEAPSADGARYTYQYAGLLGYEPVDGRLVLAYGDAKSQVTEVLRPVVPLAVVEHDLDALAKTCNAVQFNGALGMTLAEVAPPVRETPPADFVIALGDVRAPAAFRADADAELVRGFTDLLPMTGTATNTHSSGPLTRFWNDLGGEEGETPLPLGESANLQRVLRPGHMFYLPKPPWRGFRLALREPTIMRSAVGGGASSLAPLAVVLDRLDDLTEVAAALPMTGRVPLRFEAV